MDLSIIIIISQDFTALNKLLNSINENNHDLKIEILCACADEKKIDEEIYNSSNLTFKIHSFRSNNYAENCNELANKAKGKVLLFLTDTIVLDENCLQIAWDTFKQDGAGIVGINLRYSNGKIQHAGVYFKRDGTPYNRFENKLNFNDKRLTSTRVVPAVTKDFLMVNREEFLKIKFNDKLKSAGEDSVLCLQYLNKFDKDVLYVGEAKAILCTTMRNNTNIIPHSEDLKQIKIDYKDCEERINSIMDNYTVSIITDKAGWILHRMASEIKLKNVWT
jgi:hypothetical protein